MSRNQFFTGGVNGTNSFGTSGHQDVNGLPADADQEGAEPETLSQFAHQDDNGPFVPKREQRRLAKQACRQRTRRSRNDRRWQGEDLSDDE